MLDKIIAFFKRLFGGFSGKKDPAPAPKPVNKPAEKDIPKVLPKPTPDEPVDAAEIKKDTASTVVIISEEEPIILEPGDDPAGEKPTEPADTPTEPVTEVPAPGAPVHKHKQRYLWCLDNGHGSKTLGKRSPKFSDGAQFLEYEFNRDIVRRIILQLKELGVAHFNVVPEVDTDNFLEGRVSRANNKQSDLPKIFVSVHSNASGNGSDWMPASGIETWHFHDSRTGQALASIFQKHLTGQLPNWKNRKLKSYPGSRQFYVLRNTNMPAVLTENGFYDNKEECTQLMTSEVRQKIANAHVAAILEIEKNGI